MNIFIKKLINLLYLPKGLKKIKINKNLISIILKNDLYLLPYILFLKKNINYKYNVLSYITCVDNLNLKNNNNRYTINYFFLSLNFNNIINLKIKSSNNIKINSLCTIFNNANWFEREIWDMFGIFFYNHYDLRRILTDYGFIGFPLRKDYPLSGYIELRFDEKKKSIIYETLELSQKFRFFKFSNPWLL